MAIKEIDVQEKTISHKWKEEAKNYSRNCNLNAYF